MDDFFLLPDDQSLSFDLIPLTDDVSLDLLEVSQDGGNTADLSFSAIGNNVFYDVDVFADDWGSSISISAYVEA